MCNGSRLEDGAGSRDAGVGATCEAQPSVAATKSTGQTSRMWRKLPESNRLGHLTLWHPAHCHYCGRQNEPTAQFCSDCGKPLTQAAAARAAAMAGAGIRSEENTSELQS